MVVKGYIRWHIRGSIRGCVRGYIRWHVRGCVTVAMAGTVSKFINATNFAGSDTPPRMAAADGMCEGRGGGEREGM